ncbi:hypothetical protein [Rhodoblastus sp.]|uniref:hypothetical protein n=1 Tax=Rhodoblastus sp. TaxID=1962975 RepID=UPI003F9A28F0
MSTRIEWTDETWSPVVGCSLARRDGGTAYALAEPADNLRKVMSGDASLDDFRGVYVVCRDPIDADAMFPVRQ